MLILAVCLSSEKSYWLLRYYQWKAAALRAGVQSSIFVRRALPGSIYSVILFISVTLRCITALKRIVSVVSLDIRFNFRLITVQLDTLNSHTVVQFFPLSLTNALDSRLYSPLTSCAWYQISQKQMENNSTFIEIRLWAY